MRARRSVFLVHMLAGCAALAVSAAAAAAQPAPIVQPGRPGEAPRVLTAEEAARTADTRFTADDVRFMTDMIHHHQQAVAMAALVNGRSTRADLVEAARRIDASQADEIRFMRGWLTERGQPAPDPSTGGGHAGHGAGQAGGHAHHDMPGMASTEQMAALAAARGPEFDRLFLQLMIEHHEGALTMARALLRRPGAAYDPTLFEFANEVVNEQQAEINRMATILAALSEDPRAVLTAGVDNAGQASRNLRLVTHLPKPAGFFDPANPAGLPPTPQAADRAPLLSFANTDLAFQGDLMAVGNYHGFNLYRLVAGAAPRLVSSVICPGGQGDVSIVGDLLIMSVEQTRGRVDCGQQGVSEPVSADRFRGLRIFNIADPARPVQVGQVQTCRGSHTHSVVSGDGRSGSVIVYNSGTAGVRSEEELAGCVGDVPGDSRTALFRIDVIEIPVANPAAARIIDSPAVFADAETGRLAGLWRGGSHGEGTQDTSRTDQCHDITVFPSRNLAAGACSGNGIIFDISDPRRPQRIDAVVDPNFAYWHSATFNNDGTKVIFTDEWGGGGRPRCRAQDPRNWGANAIYDIVGGRDLQFRSHQKLPAVQGEMENCVAHNGSIVPVPGRDIFVQAWYQGGLSIIDFTDSANPREIAYFDRGPISGEQMVLGGFWSAYWYGDRIYATEIVRGLDVLALEPSEHLTANEIAAAALADQGGRFNPQTQYPVTWPAHPVVAMAYVDQLQRSRTLDDSLRGELSAALGQARSRVEARRRDAGLAGRLEALAGRLPAAEGDAVAARRVAALRDTLRAVAGRLR
jgi:uncharacterized protein (DUF305 family)